MRPFAIGLLLLSIGTSCAVGSGPMPQRTAVTVLERELGPATASGPLDLDALVPTAARAADPGFALARSADGAPSLHLQLRDRAPLRLRMHDLGHRDGAGGCYAVHGAESGASTDEFGVVRFARDGAHLALPLRDAQTWRVVLATREGTLYREVARSREAWAFADWPVLHPGGERVAFWAFGGAIPERSAVVEVARSGGTLEVVAHHGAGLCKLWPTWSVRGELLIRALADEKGDDERILHAGATSRSYHRTGTPRFGPRGTHWAVAVRRERQAYLLVDGIAVGPFDDSSDPHFVSEHEVGFVVRSGTRLLWRVVRVSA